jgi:SRSO17 transposase
VLVADAGYGQVGAFRQGLTERKIRYVLGVGSTTTAHPGDAEPVEVAYAGVGKRPRPHYPEAARTLKDLATTTETGTETGTGTIAAQHVRWREATRSNPDKRIWMSGWFTATRVRPAGRGVKRDDDGSYPQTWLLTQWSGPDADDVDNAVTTGEPTDYWLSDLPPDTPLTDLVALAKARWRIEHDYRELKTALGLDHFEGRSWAGWHRHVTLVTAAHPFLTIQRLTHKPGKALGQSRN